MFDEVEDTVEPHEDMPIDNIEDQGDVLSDVADYDEQPAESRADQKMVPLSALKKIREKKRELELELQWERQRNSQVPVQKPVEDDNARYESATKADLQNSQDEAVRAIEERLWIKNNPDLYEEINEHLANFLKLKPHLAMAINQAPNRYEEAYELMSKLSPKQQQQVKAQPAQQAQKKAAPNAPGSVPRAAALNDAVDVMQMDDKEFAAWRDSKRKRR
jgi:hypothetical protein